MGSNKGYMYTGHEFIYNDAPTRATALVTNKINGLVLHFSA